MTLLWRGSAGSAVLGGLALLPLWLLSGQNRLELIEAKMKALGNGRDAGRTAAAQRDLVRELIAQDALKTPESWRRAAAIFEPEAYEAADRGVRYELTLVAAVEGDALARKSLSAAWDDLQRCMSRPLRISAPGGLAAAVVRTAWTGGVAASQQSNAELQALVDADQAARHRDWSKLDQAALETIGREDEARLARAKQLVAEGKLMTADDFFNAALVAQHGDNWDDYVLAHELAVVSALGGHKSGRWLAAASYDRMLRSGGLAQRFGTQYDGSRGTLAPVLESGINDRLRRAMRCPTLKDARKHKF